MLRSPAHSSPAQAAQAGHPSLTRSLHVLSCCGCGGRGPVCAPAFFYSYQRPSAQGGFRHPFGGLLVNLPHLPSLPLQSNPRGTFPDTNDTLKDHFSLFLQAGQLTRSSELLFRHLPLCQLSRRAFTLKFWFGSRFWGRGAVVPCLPSCFVFNCTRASPVSLLL